MRRPRGIFVSGTDTGVGKTVVACALAAWARRQGVDVGVSKPIATGGRWQRGRAGHSAGRWVSDDAVRLARAAGVHDPWPLVNPICFKEPLAPWTAARRARRPVRLAGALKAVREVSAAHEWVIVEGIGGLLVPLSAHATVADLAQRIGFPILLVARPGLGTLNHTLLSLEYMRRRGLRCCGVVINHTRPASGNAMDRVAERTNPEILGQFTRVRGVGPFRSRSTRGRAAHGNGAADWIARACGRRFLQQLVDG